MWTRKELKDKAKLAFKANYWKCILVALILSFVSGSGSDSCSASGSASGSAFGSASQTNSDVLSSIYDEAQHLYSDFAYSTTHFAYLAAFVLIFVVIVILIAIPLSVFLLNPLSVGCRRYFLLNLYSPANIKEIGYCFDGKYLQCVKIMFLKDLYTSLWTLLFIIPGIVKSYEYRMIPYLLAENEDITTDEAFARSKEMMDGNKWNAFVLDLSFIGWEILNAFTLGILGIFYVNPYIHQTDAALYDCLKMQHSTFSYNDVL